MAPMLPSSRLLPATIVATSVVLAIKVVTLVVDPPTSGSAWAKTGQAVMTASVIPDAHAAGPAAPAAGSPQPAGGSAEVSPAADPAQPLPPPAATSQAGAPQAAIPPAAIPPAAIPQAAIPPAAPPPAAAPRAAVVRADAGAAASDVTLHRSQIETRELQVSIREAAVAAAEKQLTDRVAQLLAIQSRLQTLASDYKDHDDAKWAALVMLYEGMRPRDAATIFNGLDKPVLLEILGRMKPAKAAPVIALMQPENARQVTAELAARRSATAAVTN
jgi:flagellar motility protein MotE (MotC chaperone)